MIDLADLNDNQRRAVEWEEGPILILAGPGSGKTLVLTMRIARLIQDSPGEYFKVLGLTFSTRAVGEMRSRLQRILESDEQRVDISTFHSFCANILRQHGNHIGLRPNYTILTQEEDRRSILGEVLESSMRNDIPPIPVGDILSMIDFLQREGFDGGTNTQLPFNDSSKEWIRPIYREYQRRQLEGNFLDFGSLLICCLRLLREQPQIVRLLRIAYPYICVDEYQDTNRAQDMILRQICQSESPNLFVVADDDQIIFQWNGASPERLQQLREDFLMEVVQLPENYRCPQSVIVMANRLIQYNSIRSHDKIEQVGERSNGGADTVRLQRFEDWEDEIEWVARDIIERGVDPGQCAILARNTKILTAVKRSLDDGGIPASMVQRKDSFETPALRFVSLALSLANAPRDILTLRKLCKVFFEISSIEIRAEMVDAESAMHGGALLRGFFSVASTHITEDSRLRELVTALGDELAERLNYIDFVNCVFNWFTEQMNYDVPEMNERNEEANEMEIWKNHMRQIDMQLGKNITLSQFLQEMNLRPKVTLPKEGEVQCLTIHSAKGREYNEIYLVGLAEDVLPSYYAKKCADRTRGIEEERRSCFVAITRSQRNLTITYSNKYFGYAKQPSRFLSEMGLKEGFNKKLPESNCEIKEVDSTV